MDDIRTMSRDGTEIAVYRTGTGPPLILSTGSLSDHRRWFPVLPYLKEDFTIYTYDRRGRGASSDIANYDIEREFEDIDAIAHSIKEPVNLLGHSYGAILALEAALRIKNIDKLILYEPPVHVGVEVQRTGIADRIHSLVEEGDREGAILTFYTDVQKRAPEELQKLQNSSLWDMFLAAAHTLSREMRCVDAYKFNASRFQNMQIPTLLLLGERSPAFFAIAMKTINETLPDSRIVTMPGQGHAAMDSGTALFTSEIVKFLTE